MEKYIIVETVPSTAKKPIALYGIFELDTDWTVRWYRPYSTLEDRMTLSQARKRLEELQAAADPQGCRARYEFILTRARELADSYINGNRSDVLAALQELPPRVSLAVLATISFELSTLEFQSLKRYLQEMA